MVLVFSIIFIVLLIAVLVALSTIRIKVEKIYISNFNNQSKLEYDYKIYLQIYFLNKIKILSIKIDKEKMKKIDIKEKLKKINIGKMKKDLPSKKEAKEILKKLNIELPEFKLDLEIGTEDIIITSVIIAIISASLGIGLAQIIKNYKKEKYKYKIVPIYQNKNQIKFWLNCIIQVKVVHIICIIYVLLKRRRVDKNERTSNRRTYDYSYE